MHNQSDHGYAIGDTEFRSKELCLRRAEFCDRQSALLLDHVAIYVEWAKQWREEAKTAPSEEGDK